MEVCILCNNKTKLSNSHILPRSFFSKLKSGSPQLIKANTSLSAPPVMDNANWNEKLLCAACETFLNTTYESSQISYLRSYKTITKSHDKLTYRNFNFTKFYLMWLSILWRASASSLDSFKFVEMGPEINDIIKNMIINRSTTIAGIDATEIIKIGIIRLLAPEIMNEREIQQMLTSPIVKHTNSGFSFHFVVEGFLILYVFSADKSFVLPKRFGEIKRSAFLRIPRVHIFESQHATEIFRQMGGVVDAYSDWRHH